MTDSKIQLACRLKWSAIERPDLDLSLQLKFVEADTSVQEISILLLRR